MLITIQILRPAHSSFAITESVLAIDQIYFQPFWIRYNDNIGRFNITMSNSKCFKSEPDAFKLISDRYSVLQGKYILKDKSEQRNSRFHEYDALLVAKIRNVNSNLHLLKVEIFLNLFRREVPLEIVVVSIDGDVIDAIVDGVDDSNLRLICLLK